MLFRSPDGLLLPGMFVRARLAQARDPAALLVPQAAVQRNDKGEAVAWVVAADGKATQKRLQVVEGPRNQWRVLSGLSAGDRVVTEGSAKIRAGQLVHAVAAGAAASAPAASAPASAASAR